MFKSLKEIAKIKLMCFYWSFGNLVITTTTKLKLQVLPNYQLKLNRYIIAELK